jgi:Fe-S-cluster containining protein
MLDRYSSTDVSRTSLTGTDLTTHMRLVDQRWQGLRDSSAPASRANTIHTHLDHPAFERLLNTARKARNVNQRVLWLQRAADALGRAAHASGATPCRKGCNHCCHIPVLVTRAEAALIAAATNRTLATSPRDAVVLAHQLEQLSGQSPHQDPNARRWAHHTGQACPFLDSGDGSCTVWNARPLACRYHYSLDDDDLLCQLVNDDAPINVPLLNTNARKAVSLAIQGLQQEAADIRDWFPSDPAVS